jgi:multiple sugar transport system permease protein/raffinose/stachyose/melibiose transport system permease protein
MRIRPETRTRILFLAAPFILYGVVVIYPLLDSFRYSLTEWNGFSEAPVYTGLDNFARIFTDPLFANAIVNTLIWTALAIVLPTGLGLVLALLLNEGVRGARVFKSLFYLPICLSAVVVGQIWIWIYQPQWGLLNQVLVGVGLKSLRTAWLADPDTALYAVILAWTWQQTGLAMVIFLAGLTAIPRDLIEAAKIDGATWLQAIGRVVVPMLRPATVVVVALSVINSLKGFDIVYTMTGGGPFHSSDTLAMFMYDESFKKYRIGYGSAISVFLFLITLAVIALYFRQLRKLDRLYG